jgi:hypothetical protein
MPMEYFVTAFSGEGGLGGVGGNRGWAGELPTFFKQKLKTTLNLERRGYFVPAFFMLWTHSRNLLFNAKSLLGCLHRMQH